MLPVWPWKIIFIHPIGRVVLTSNIICTYSLRLARRLFFNPSKTPHAHIFKWIRILLKKKTWNSEKIRRLHSFSCLVGANCTNQLCKRSWTEKKSTQRSQSRSWREKIYKERDVRRNEQDTKLRPWKFFDSSRNESSLQQKLAQKKESTQELHFLLISFYAALCRSFFRATENTKKPKKLKNMRNSRHTRRPRREVYTFTCYDISSLSLLVCGLAMLGGAGL